MQPLPNPDDLPTLLGRFHTWAEKQPVSENGNGHRNDVGVDGVRELTYEEAMEQHRSRQAPQRERRTTSARTRSAAESGNPQPEPSIARAIEAAAATKTEKPQLPGEPALVETCRPSEEPVASPQVELRLAAGSRANPTTRTSAPVTAKNAAVASSVRRPAKNAAHPAVKPKVAATGKATAITAAKPIKATAAARPVTKKPSAADAKKRAKKQPEFRQVLAKTLRAAKKPDEKKKTKAPDRTRRITTRFSTAEERRIEKAASLAGMTVSAYLRKCALAAEQGQAAQPRASAKKGTEACSAMAPEPETRLFMQPATTSLVGGWLTLLRQRFLSSPTRLSERA